MYKFCLHYIFHHVNAITSPEDRRPGMTPELERMLRRVKSHPEECPPETILALAHTCERLAAELARRESMDYERFHFAAIVQSSDVAIVRKDLKGIIRSWNPGAEKLFGHRAEEVINRSITLLMPEGQENEEMHILEKIRYGQQIKDYETLRRHKDGRLVPVSLCISPVRNDEGKVIGGSKIARDMSNRREIQAKSDLIEQLQSSLAEIKTLRGFIPMCAHCKKIRDDAGYWQGLEQYLSRRTTARFSHGVCPTCLDKHYGELMSSQL